MARYEAGDYGGSAEEFAESGDTRNLYNLGNAMAQQGQLDAAIDAYEEVLEREPDNEDARHNLEFVKNLKDQQEQQQGQGDDQQSDANQGGEGQQSDGEGEPSEDGSESDSQSEPSENGGEPRDEEMSEEDLEALQQDMFQGRH